MTETIIFKLVKIIIVMPVAQHTGISILHLRDSGIVAQTGMTKHVHSAIKLADIYNPEERYKIVF